MRIKRVIQQIETWADARQLKDEARLNFILEELAVSIIIHISIRKTLADYLFLSETDDGSNPKPLQG